MLNTQPLPRSTRGLPPFRLPSAGSAVRAAVFAAMSVTMAVSLLVAASTFIPRLFGLQTMVVTSGSMQPFLDPGDVALVRSSEARDVRLGDAISFYRPDGRGLITHRVIDIKVIDGVLYFQTQGDNNPAPDANLAPANALYGIVDGKLPKIGYLLQRVTTDKLLRLLVLSVPVLVIAAQELRSLAKSARDAATHADVKDAGAESRDERAA